jgi:glycosyltransferase involved in cell wall biosynthesis
MNRTVACITVTQEGREKLLMRSIKSFENQTYSHSRLVVVADGDPNYLHRLGLLLSDRAQFLPVPLSHAPLGRLRNIALDFCKEDYATAQWDDDDQYHPDRLTIQIDKLDRADACLLCDQLHYIADLNAVYWTDWLRGTDHAIPGTIVSRVSDLRFPPEDRKHEDSHFRDELIARHKSLSLIQGKGWLYLRVYHGKNTWSRSHHLAGIRARARSVYQIQRQEDVLTEALRNYEWDHSTVQVMGRDGLAFEVKT